MSNGHLQGFIHRLRTAAAVRGLPGVPDAQLLERFTTQRDEAAFELLVWRHGGMVFNLCRRLLGDAHEAEDAFQACFLTLARRAGSINRRESLAGWLHKVALRIALAARERSDRVGARAAGEAALDGVSDGADPAAEAAWREVRQAIDDEVDRLPGKYRLPFILCYFQGQTNAEAARELGCPVGTVESRLAWARERLRSRLSRRGIALSGGLFVLLLSQKAASASAPALLVASTGKAVALLAAGQAAAGILSARAVALSEGVLRAMFLAKLKATAGVLLAAGLVAACGLACRTLAVESGGSTPTAEPPRHAARDPEAVRIAHWIGQLGSDRFEDRETASKGLEKIGVPALGALRRATHNPDPEVRRRAESLVDRISKAALKEEILRPTRVRLAFKDVSVEEAVADLRAKSGYAITLRDPEGKLRDRKVTLDTGETTFWQAFDQLCQAAGLVEVPALPGQLLLQEGKPEDLPTHYAGAVRIRARAGNRADEPGAAGKNEVPVHLQYSLEPKAVWHGRSALHLSRALDDQGQELKEARRLVMTFGGGGGKLVFTTDTPFLPADLFKLLCLKKGDKEAKALQELKGELSADVVLAPSPVLTVDDLLGAARKTFHGAEGGSLTVLEVVWGEGGRVTVRLKLTPPPGLVAPWAGRGAGLRLKGTFQGGVGGDVVLDLRPSSELPAQDIEHGLLLFDAKGNAVEREIKRVPAGGPADAFEYVMTFQVPKEPGSIRLVWTGSRSSAIDFPFALGDIRLP